ncbi:MAG: PAS domain S-box protein [Rhodoferax sp.]|nr:PAS domain S-box protein [Rhodoferax sp.]
MQNASVRTGRSNDLFQCIVEDAADGIVVVDAEGRITFCNLAFAQLFQRKTYMLQGAVFGFPLVTGESTEINVRRKDGSQLIAEMRVSHTHTGSGKQQSFVAMLRDISERKAMEQAIVQAKEQLAALYHCAPLGIIATTPGGCIELWNPAATAIFDWKANEVFGRNFFELLKLPESVVPATGAAAGQDKTITGKEIRHIRSSDGAEIRISVSLAPIRNQDGVTTGLICMVEDISGRKRIEERLRLSSRIFDDTREGIMVTDAKGFIQTVNRSFVRITGYSVEEAVGRKPSLLRSDRHDKEYYERMWQAITDHGYWRGEIWNRRKNGEIYPESINISAIHDHDGEVSHYVAIFSDITRAKKNEERLRYLAHYDELTGLANRFLFNNHVELALTQALRKGRQVAILFLDLDKFKSVNDTLGHRAGDTLLREVAQRLLAVLRASDTLSRFGGDEFNAVLPDLESDRAAAEVAAKFIKALASPFLIEGIELHIGVSIGIAIFPQHGSNLVELSRAADEAMYQVKLAGRNAYGFYRGSKGSDKQ